MYNKNLLKALFGLLQRDVFPVTGQLLAFDLVVIKNLALIVGHEPAPELAAVVHLRRWLNAPVAEVLLVVFVVVMLIPVCFVTMTTLRAAKPMIAANRVVATFQHNDVCASNSPAGHSIRSVLHARMRDARVRLVVSAWFVAKWTLGSAAPNFFGKEKSDVLCLAAGDEIAIIPPISGG